MEVRPGNGQARDDVIPADWTPVRLGGIGRWFSGGTPSMSNSAYWGGKIPWVSPKDMKESRLRGAIDHVSDEAIGHGTRLIPAGALLVVVRGMILAHSFPVARAECPLAFNQDLKAVVTRDDIDSNFLLHWLQSKAQQLRHLATESTHGTKRIPTEGLFSTECICPPLPEQRAIAGVLGDVDALLGALAQLIAKKRDLKQAAMQQLLTGQIRLPGFHGEWEVKRLGDVFKFLRTANNPRSDLSDLGDVRYIHYGDIHTAASTFLDFSETTMPLIAKSKVATIPLVQDGDLLMVDASEDYAGIGKCVEVRNARGQETVAGLHTFLLRGNEDLIADGFKGYLQFFSSVRAAIVRLATGVSVYGILKSSIQSIEVALPRVDEQIAIATVLSDMDAEIASVEERLAKTRALKWGMMHELLTGRTRLV